jgi:hypothetical protein
VNQLKIANKIPEQPELSLKAAQLKIWVADILRVWHRLLADLQRSNNLIYES